MIELPLYSFLTKLTNLMRAILKVEFLMTMVNKRYTPEGKCIWNILMCILGRVTNDNCGMIKLCSRLSYLKMRVSFKRNISKYCYRQFNAI